MLALLSSGIISGLGGCVDGRDRNPRSAPTESPTTTPPIDSSRSPGTPPEDPPSPDPNTPPDGWPPPAWKPEWTHGVPVSHIVGLDVVDDRLVITANGVPGPTIVQAYDTDDRTVLWERKFEGGAIPNSMLDRGPVERTWGITDTGSALLSVTGVEDERWSELHALVPESGEQRWSLRRDRELAVRGVVDGTIYLLAREFEEETTADHHFESDTPTPEPLRARLVAVELTDGSVNWNREFTGVGDVSASDSGVFVAVMNRLLRFDHDGHRDWVVRGNSRGTAIYPTAHETFYVSKPEWNRMVVRGVTTDGRVRWRHRFDADEAVARGDRLYVAGGELARIRPDGTVEWRTERHAGRLTFPPTRQTIYIRTGRQADAVSAISQGDGSVQWTFDPPLNNAWPESATDETVVVGGIGQIQGGVRSPLYRVNASDGEPTARYLDRDSLTTHPFGDHVFVGSGDYDTGGRLLALPL